jgi:hypothetical protein
MKLSAPKFPTWLISVILGGIGILMFLGVIGVAGLSGFWLVAIGLIILVLGTTMRGL